MNGNVRIYIVGQNALLNQLLGTVVANEVREPCEAVPGIETVCAVLNEWLSRVVILVDDTDARARRELLRLLSDAPRRRNQGLVAALFNVDRTQSGARDAVERGVRGVFFSCDPISEVTRGVRCLLCGEHWTRTTSMVGHRTPDDSGNRPRST